MDEGHKRLLGIIAGIGEGFRVRSATNMSSTPPTIPEATNSEW